MTVAEQELKHIEESQEKMQSEENVTVPSTEKTINLESDDEACDEDYANEDDEGREEKWNAGCIFMLNKIKVILTYNYV